MILANCTGMVLRQVRDKCKALPGAIDILTSTASSQSLFEMGSGLQKCHLVSFFLVFGHLPLGLNDPVHASRHGLDQGLAEGWKCSHCQRILISFCSSSKLEQWLSFSWFFIQFHRFSMWLRSSEFPGQSTTLHFLWANQFMMVLALWQGAPSCRNLVVLACCMAGYNFFFRTYR